VGVLVRHFDGKAISGNAIRFMDGISAARRRSLQP
jgi:hypothetical protein